MAIPISALTSAGASLTPSPTIATFLPSDWISATLEAFSSGKTSAIIVSIPTCFAIACAVRLLSPVNIATSIPNSWSFWIACWAVSLTVSATATTPLNSLSTLISIAVFPSFSNWARFVSASLVWIPFSLISFRFPTKSSLPSIVAFIPRPGIASKWSTSKNSNDFSLA